MCRKQGKYFVCTFHRHCVFMVVSTYCHCFSVIYQGLMPLRLVFFVHYIYNLQHSHFLLATCLESIQTLQHIWKWCKSCNSCPVHGPSKYFQCWPQDWILCRVQTRFATWFYAMHRLLRLKRALKATIHGAVFESVVKNAKDVLAVEDIEDEVS